MCLDQIDLEDWPELGSAKLTQHFSHSTGPGRNHESVRNTVYHHPRLLLL